jgi:hypothetical protein
MKPKSLTGICIGRRHTLDAMFPVVHNICNGVKGITGLIHPMVNSRPPAAYGCVIADKCVSSPSVDVVVKTQITYTTP